MPQTLLATKLHIPEHPGVGVPRARLTEALEHGIVRSRLTLVAAPAGFGKTTLLAEWARTTNVPVAWLSLGSDDDDPDSFLRYLLAAWERIEPEVASSPLAILLGSQGPNREAVLTAFLNAAAGLRADQALILDDYHLIHDPAIHASLAYLLDYLPPRLHVVIGTRAEPEELPLARYRARGQLLQIHAEDLRFSLEEAVEFLNRAAGSRLTSEDIQQWHKQLEGWAAGLQLAALSGQRPSGGAMGAADLSGRQRYIADYLAQEVLALLPAEVQAFLLRTSILDRLCAPLAETVTGTAGGQPMLERLERENLFVQALDEERNWFRYHPLFASFLQAELEQRLRQAAGVRPGGGHPARKGGRPGAGR